jgi:hypothetical protein
VLGGLAEFERELIAARTGERERAKARGVKMGRKPGYTREGERYAVPPSGRTRIESRAGRVCQRGFLHSDAAEIPAGGLREISVDPC